MKELHHEAELFTKYIVGKPGNIANYEQYVSGVASLNLILTCREEQMMRMLNRFSFLLPFCDAGLAVLSPQCTVRKRLLLMYAIIETDKQFVSNTINTKDRRFSLMRLMIRGCIGAFKAVFGIVLILVMGWK